MATQLQIRRGTTAQMNAFTGAEGELAVNTTTDTLHIHDGATAGGKALARADGSNIATYAGSFTTLTASGAATLNTLASSGATLTGGTINGVTVGASTPSTGAFTTIAASGAITGNVTGNLTGSVLTAAQTNITSVGTLSTLAVSGAITANGGIDIDNINIDGTTIALSSGDLTLDSAGDITLDFDGGDLRLKDGGTEIGLITSDGSNLGIFSRVSDKDIIFYGNDGGSTITALTLDMSEAGAASFSGNVGIGRDPRVALDVTGEVAIAYNASYGLRFYNQPQNNWSSIGNNLTSAAANLVFKDSTGEVMRIESGNVKIGDSATDVTSKLVVSGNAGTRVASFMYDGSAGTYLDIDCAAANGAVTLAADARSGSFPPLIFKTSNTERMQLRSDGNLNLGDISNGQIVFQMLSATDGANTIHFGDANSGNQMYNGYINYQHGSSPHLAIQVNNAERMRLTAAGDLYFAQTAGSTSNVGTILQANGRNFFMASTTSEAVMHTYNNTSSSGAKYKISFQQNGTQVGVIEVGSSSTGYITLSDYRLKENVVAMSGATERLKQLNPSRFNFIADADTTVDGFLAHEVQDVVPEAITGTKDAMRDEEYEVTPAVLDDDGNVTTEAVMGTRSVPDYQGIDQSKLVPLLVATIQELEARLTALENN